MEPQHNMWQMLRDLWNWPSDQRTLPYVGIEYLRNPAVSAEAVWLALSQSFPYSEIEVELSRLFREMMKAFRRNEQPTAYELFLADCSLSLLTMSRGFSG